MTNFFIDLIFPKFCVGCNKFNTHICKKCFEAINFYPFDIKPEVEQNYLDKLIAMAQYEGVVKKLITILKYQSVKNIGQTLGRMIYYTTNFPQPDIITCVPLHKKRQHERGFNQATEIALELSKIAKIPFMQLLKRAKHSEPQAKISDKNKRLTRLKNTFILNSKPLPGKTVLIIDDVTTTGTTLNECAQVLKQAGIKKIFGLAVAHGN